MKKILALVLAMLLVVGMFAGCEKKEDAKPEETTAPAESQPEALKTVAEGKLTMATNAFFAPYEYYEGEKIVGIDAEIAEAIAKKLGLELEIKNMDFDSIITAVTNGDADFGLAGMTVTEDRLKEVDFSISYASGVQSIIVKEGSPITCYEDMTVDGATYKIAVQRGTTGDIYATGEFGEDNVTAFASGNEAVLALTGGAVDCVIIDNEPAKALVAANEGLVILETSYAEEDYAACFAQDNDQLLNAVNAAIKELIADGTIDAIIEKYIPANG